MKVSEQWLREWVDPPLSSTEIAERLTLAGLEVDGVLPAGPALDGVVVADVLEVAAHPDAERLKVCRVRSGDTEATIVCGAPNVRAGLKAAWARPGTMLPKDVAVATAAIRGVESDGMLCSAAELGLGDDAAGLLELPPETASGQGLAASLGLDDVVFDIGLTPNRGDCFCTLGIARDLAVLTGSPLRPAAVPPVAAATAREFGVELAAAAACPRYAGRVIEGIDPGATTPLWMQEYLRRGGVRCIHPVVDITNFVMLELGQPMHAFDLAQLAGRIIVREAAAGETVELLDGQNVTLEAGTLVIADAERPVALAGVMGGAGSAVGEETRDVFLESAWFDPVRLAGVARHYRLQTDASTRFERGVDPTEQLRAIERATALILEICGGRPGPTTLAEVPDAVPARPLIEFRPQSVNRLLGTALDDDRVHRILTALDLAVERTHGAWRVTPPAFRPDIALEADLVEEVARIHGYDNIPTRLPRGAQLPAVTLADSARETALRHALVERGYFEAITYSFVARDLATAFQPAAAVTALANPISADMGVMRPSLWPGLVEAARHNLNRQHEDVRLFEIGMVFAAADGGFAQVDHIAGLRSGHGSPGHWSGAGRDVDFFDLKQDVEIVLKKLTQVVPAFEPVRHPALHPGQAAAVRAGGRLLGHLGALHPRLAQRLDIDKPMFLFELTLADAGSDGVVQYRPISKFPAVRRDVSVVVDESISAAACLDAARAGAGALLRDLQLFDVYRGQGIDSDKKSLSLGLIFQDVSSTLTDDEVDRAVTRVLDALSEHVGGTLRN
ncbi:MAG: phenylalanine--tRNA ligase subunit beta [Gammaproteobacteria bacterium]